MKSGKPILSIDFDGVIHDYKRGWQDGTIYGDVTPGFFAWAQEAAKIFTLVIHSSRAKTEAGMFDIEEWMVAQGEKQGYAPAYTANTFTVQAEKPPAFLTIDDRAVRFDGDWSKLDPKALLRFKPWTQTGVRT